MSHIYNLKEYEKIEITSRVKECESSIKSLLIKHAQGGFDPEREYSLTSLKDLVGVRVSIFPTSLLLKIRKNIKAKLNWLVDSEHRKLKVWKYQGTIKKSKIGCEVQVVPLLLSAYWKIEHATFYKPHSELRGVAEDLKLKAINNEVLEKLAEFEEAFEEFLKFKK